MLLSFKVGDGTTSVVLLAGEILKHVKGFVEDGLHPQVRPDSFYRVGMGQEHKGKYCNSHRRLGASEILGSGTLRPAVHWAYSRPVARYCGYGAVVLRSQLLLKNGADANGEVRRLRLAMMALNDAIAVAAAAMTLLLISCHTFDLLLTE